jgi:hypothetical protein
MASDSVTVTFDMNNFEEVTKKAYKLIETARSKNELKKNELNNKLLTFADKKSAKDRKAWANALKHDLATNVDRLLKESMDILCDSKEVGPTISKNALALGNHGSPASREFLVKLIHSLYESGEFKDEDGDYDTFEDTASGCDEIVWERVCELLGNSGTTTPPISAV